jgi:c-di-GMP-binding flagellar brake protein YcgR
MKSPAERRKAPRTRHAQALTLKVVESTTRALAPGHTLQAHTADVSDTGVRVHLMTAVPVGAELELWVIPLQQRETLVLKGRVCWCLAEADDATRYQAGVEIAHRPAAEYQKWRELAARVNGG